MATNSSVSVNSPAASRVSESHDLVTEILSRIPARVLFRFKCVAQYWCHLISDDRKFGLLQTKRNPLGTCSGLISFSSDTPAEPKKLDFLWISERHRFRPPPSQAMSFLESMSCSQILDSSNGLLLCSSTNPDCTYFVCNLLLGRFCRLDLPADVGVGDREVLGLTLAFDPTRWTGFKAVCFSTRAVDVYSSNDGSWKRVVQGAVLESNLAFEDGAYWNGKAIWLRKDRPRALGRHNIRNSEYFVLSLDEGTFHFYPLPCSYSMVCYFGESMGQLHLVAKDPEAFNIYKMGGDGLEWVIKYRLIESVTRTRLGGLATGYQPISDFVWGGSWVLGVVRNEEGLIVIWYLPCGAGRVVAYDCETGLVSTLSESKSPGKAQEFIESLYWIESEVCGVKTVGKKDD